MKMQNLVLEEGFIAPEMGIEYPERPDEPLLHPERTREVDVESGYPFLDRSARGRLLNFAIYAGIFCIVFLLNKILYGIRIEGRENLRKNRALLKNGAMTVANHVHRWDFIFVLQAVRWRRMWFPAKAENLESGDAPLIRGVGGIPIPKTLAATRKFNEAFNTLHAEKRWLHVFPESCRWNYYAPIRPFKLGAFKMAHRYQIPIVPVAISWRAPSGIWKLLKVRHPLVTVRIGEPIPTENPGDLSKNDFCRDLRKKAHDSLCTLAGIRRNVWEAEGD